MWGFGVMNQVAIQEAANIRFPMENFIGNWWAGAEHDVTPAGDVANGYKSLVMNDTGDAFPIYADITKYVVDAGKAAGAGDNLGTVMYNRSLYMAFLTHMAIEKAQELSGNAGITQAEMVAGMEALSITDALMEEHGIPDIGPEFSVSCENHGGPGLGAVAQWDASAGKWNLVSDYLEADMAVINPLIDADSKAYAAENNIAQRCG